jgi:hypothetical protein
LLLLTLLIFLFPVAVYCWVLGLINRRLHPVMVPGPWDFLGLLFAASGFLLWVGPALLRSLFSQARGDPLMGDRAGVLTTLLWDLLQWGVWVAYFVIVLGGALLLLWARRRKTVIYNVDSAVLETMLTRSLARLGLAWTRQGNRLYLGIGIEPIPQEMPAATAASTAAPGAVRASLERSPATATTRSEPTILDLEFFRALDNVTLHWRGPSIALREEVETELAKELAEVLTQHNPAGTWLLWISAGLFALMFFSVLVVVLNTFLSNRR